MEKRERVLACVPKAWYKLDEWFLFFTDRRMIAVKFMAWKSIGPLGFFGQFDDERERKKIMMIKDPNYLLPMKGTFTIDYGETNEIFFKRAMMGAKIIFDCSDGNQFTFKIDGKQYFDEAIKAIEPTLGIKLKTKK
ncbi:MAG: PH domain-containing protein [Thermoplasmata archaeon]|nr:PH domain-containing protein [Thermoplasmata archaeon]